MLEGFGVVGEDDRVVDAFVADGVGVLLEGFRDPVVVEQGELEGGLDLADVEEVVGGDEVEGVELVEIGGVVEVDRVEVDESAGRRCRADAR